MAHEILIVDDETDIRTSLSGLLEDEGYTTRQAASGQEALDMVGEKQPDLVLLDIWMEGMDGLECLSRLKRRAPDLPVVMISGHGTIETAVQATLKGAYDFIEKPPSVERLLLTIDRAIREFQLRRENVLLRSRSGEVHELLGGSSEIAAVRHTIRQVAGGDSRVMLTGESGAGKEIVARLIHQTSMRKDKPFASLSPAAISDATVDVVLSGILDQIKGGTLFLDEVADLTAVMQAKLLRFLQQGGVEDPKTGQRKEADVRIISSTTRDIAALVEGGEFRADLYYRLNVVPVHVPALRTRSVDIPPLVQHFVKILSPDASSQPKMSPATMAVLTSYPWPGNVRQLRNLVEWLIIMHPGKAIEPDMLPTELTRGELPVDDGLLSQIVTLPLREAREMFEKSYLCAQLRRFSGNISRTADFVGMERSALHRKLKTLGVESREA
ncbi:MAG: response regulator [Proteobacteria bacterium]|nr:response regulator [Pseudomonadota bacterium]